MAKKLSPKNGGLFKKDISKISEGYYSGDQPNPNLRSFVESHVKTYDPETDGYSIGQAFSKPVDVKQRKSPITDLHIYWSKKHPTAIRQYIEHYTKPGDLVLDPFCGSGMTALVSNQLGRHCIAIDLSPAATFITKNYCTPVDSEAVREECQRVLVKVKEKLAWLYETRCDRCGGPAETAYMVYSFTTQCLRCLKTFPVFDSKNGNDGEAAACPHCGDPLPARVNAKGYVPVETSYICLGRCKPSRGYRSPKSPSAKARQFFHDLDLTKIRGVEKEEIPFEYPNPVMPQNTLSHRLYPKGISHFKDIYTQRNFWAICALLQEIHTSTPTHLRDSLLFIMGTVVFPTSKMCCHDYPSTLKGTYYVPMIGRELSVFENFEGRVNRKSKGLAEVTQSVKPGADLIISTQSACDLSQIPSNSIDLVFTDPPYGDKVPFWELNLIWEYWWGFNTDWETDEIIINPRRGKTEAEWTIKMRAAFQEMYRVLKPGRWLSLCYHDTSEMTWEAIQDLAAEVGFHPDTAETALFIDVQQKTFKQLREREGERVQKRDLVVNFRKPLPSELGSSSIIFTGAEDPKTFREKAGDVIKRYLADNPGSPRDRVYDALVSNLVRKGQMERHEFDAVLKQFAEPAGDDPNRWYLKAEAEEALDASEARKEEAAAGKLRSTVAQHIAKHPHEEGIRYSNLFEAYLYVVPSKEKPKRELKEFILDFLIRTLDGAYRLPISEDEQKVLTEARRTGANRRIRRFVRLLEAGVSLPANTRPNDATLSDWIRHCKRSGLYEQGKLLYERGGLDLNKLSEELMADVEEDYQVCVRMLARSSGSEGKRSKGVRRKKLVAEE